MLHIGCHLSVSAGFLKMGRQALALQADTFQFFTRNPRGSRAKAMDPQDAQSLMDLCREHNFAPLVAHAPYTLNPCSADPHVREFALQTMEDDLARMDFLPGNYYNFHPGSHVGQGAATGVALISQALNQLVKPGLHTTVLLETMAGKGSEVGGTFQELRDIISRVEHGEELGVCLDTCHVWDAGYDLAGNLEGVLEEFDRVLGLERLKAVHLNDSKNPLGARKDRHEKLGQGCIGLEALVKVAAHPALRDLPFNLETPNELEGYAEEISLMRRRYEEELG